MAFETKNQNGALFKAEKRSDNAPDYTGNAVVNGKAMRIAAWIKKDRNGKSYMSLLFSDPAERSDSGRGETAARGNGDQDIPF